MELNKFIDHTLLKPEALPEDIVKLCEEAKEYGFFSVCVNSYYVPLAKAELSGSDVEIASVIGFPLGAMSTSSKVFETEDACRSGASEIDMVINVGLLKAGKYEECKEDIAAVVRAAHNNNAIVKVIIETCLLSKDEIVKACTLSKEANADFVKTSTGFSTGGAKEEDVKLMRETVGPDIGVKASGGIRDLDTAQKMINAGASRLGASAGVSIMQELNSK